MNFGFNYCSFIVTRGKKQLAITKDLLPGLASSALWMQFPGGSQSLHTSSGYWSRLTRAQEPTAYASPHSASRDITPGNRVQPRWEYGRHTNQCLFFFFFGELSFKHLSVHHGPYWVALFPFMFTLKQTSLIAWVRDESQLCQFQAMKPQTIYLVSLCLSFSIYKTQIITSCFTELWEVNAIVYTKCLVLLYYILFWPTFQKTLWGETDLRTHYVSKRPLSSSKSRLFRTLQSQDFPFWDWSDLWRYFIKSLDVKALPIFHQRIKSIWKKNAKLI